jgi:acetylornithine deacetylase/succinyl-diaminopimelate desuccinylase-like protein
MASIYSPEPLPEDGDVFERQRAMRPGFLTLAALLAVTQVGRAQGSAQSPDQQLARDLLAELVGINTTAEHGNTTPAAAAMATRLLGAGFPDSDVVVVGAGARNRNLVARLRGKGKGRPILLLAHLDVVEALRSDWSLEPFTLTEQNGFFYGRGTSDIKDMAAIFVATLIRLKHEGFIPDRDVILALTAGEETGDDNGVSWLLAHRRDLIDAEYCINGDAGDPIERAGHRIARVVEASEKVYQDFRLEVHNPGGHSSMPVPDNAIYRLAAALERLAAFRFPVSLNGVTRSYFDRMASTQPPDIAADMRAVLGNPLDSAAATRLSDRSPLYNSILRTTCVATRLEGGHANNALPQTARAVVNCRILPQESMAQAEATLRTVVADSGVAVIPIDTAIPSPPSPLVPAVFGPLEQVTHALWPGVPVIPNMETGATDGLFLRNAGMPVYGVSGVFLDADDIRAHGRDERIGVRQFYEGAEFTYRFVKALSHSAPR